MWHNRKWLHDNLLDYLIHTRTWRSLCGSFSVFFPKPGLVGPPRSSLSYKMIPQQWKSSFDSVERDKREKKWKKLIIIILKVFRKGACHLEAKNHLEACNPSTLQQFFAITIKLSIISCIVPFQHKFSLKCPKPVAQRSFSHMCQNYVHCILFRWRCSNLYLEWGPSSVCWNALLQ